MDADESGAPTEVAAPRLNPDKFKIAKTCSAHLHNSIMRTLVIIFRVAVVLALASFSAPKTYRNSAIYDTRLSGFRASKTAKSLGASGNRRAQRVLFICRFVDKKLRPDMEFRLQGTYRRIA